jgi:uncharacterized protein YfcZ (UPF0381/DUF406 family)
MKYFMPKLLFAVLTAGLIQLACQAVPKVLPRSACAELDWFEIGRAEGVLGQPSSGWEVRQQSCSDFSKKDHENYLHGWNAGITDFCTESQGFVMGRSGRPYQGVCSPGQEPGFLKGYDLGKRIHNFDRENRQISQELERLNQEINKSSSNQSQIMSQINRLETQMELNQATISSLQSELESTLVK